ncbi:aldo/keto reductase [Pseudonocardia xinjiangensis]|uniref:aldo/keto reductase n=1 Tax=Pseudonocardia xinjiangensis TaxID=75289 RepID=UPI003D8DF8E0
MKQRPLGGTGLTVSQVLLGCGSIGGIGTPASTRGKGLRVDEGLAQIDAADTLGITVLDTADSYSGGISEQVVGLWSIEHPDSEMLISTKVGNLVSPQQRRVTLTAEHITRQFAISEERLGRVDLYLSHGPDDETPIEETLETFAGLLESGRIRGFGACNVSASQLESALIAADRHGLPRYEWVQNEYNLLNRDDESDVWRLVAEHCLGYTPYSPLAGGTLSGRYQQGVAPDPGSRLVVAPGSLRPLDEPTWRGLDLLTTAARRRGVGTAALALAWVTSAPLVTAPLVAPRNKAQFTDVSDALDLTLDPDERAEIATFFDRIS